MQFGVCNFFCPAMHFKTDKVCICILSLTNLHTVSYPKRVLKTELGTHNFLPTEMTLNEKTVYENRFLDPCVSAIFEFSGNEFDSGKNKIRREREPIIFSI
jgi:hypothetical protein